MLSFLKLKTNKNTPKCDVWTLIFKKKLPIINYKLQCVFNKMGESLGWVSLY